MLELYHNGMSTCSQKVRLCLAEKGLDWTGHAMDLRAGDQHRPDYLSLNPNGVVPTLVDGDFIFVNKYAYGLRLPVVHTKIFKNGEPQRGDVVVFRLPR